jgi:hypothetical protein
MLTDDDLRKFLRPLTDNEVQALRHSAHRALGARPGMVAKGAAVLSLIVGVWLAASAVDRPDGAADIGAIPAKQDAVLQSQRFPNTASEDASASDPDRDIALSWQP